MQIDRSHLPDDFLEELSQQPAGGAWNTPVSGASALATAAKVAGQAGAVRRHSLQDVALSAMAQVLRQHKGNVSAAAKALGVSRNTIYRKKDQLPPDVWN